MHRIQQTLKGWADEASSGTYPGRAMIKHILPSMGSDTENSPLCADDLSKDSLCPQKMKNWGGHAANFH